MHFSQQMTTLLTSIDYPAHPSDLIREAMRDGVPVHERAQLNQLPDRAYQGVLDVARTLAGHTQTDLSQTG